ncbi:hypothetical protein B5C34_05175 [Pacificimonas flava]|uniref:F5/8 type C domain-containing protein n=2 Tax=Pacificimonas TaxID=1960290 RepID=A0A219B433_9SPHN|nr:MULTISPECIES: hypothetical protein [Pacificimonas]MBZ6377390.1 hypothetical protein [Pacificimonas aurantium]OWV32903.1 hypothetical protein B5C34_05175 [Pacificimonas flava]
MGLILLEPIAFADVAADSGTGDQFFQSRDPKESWTGAGSSDPAEIYIDLGAARAFDTIAFVNTVATGMTVEVDGGASYQTELLPGDALAEIGSPHRGCFIRRFSGLQIERYLRVTFTPTTAVPACARIVLSRALTTGWDREFGYGRKRGSTGSAERLASGGFAVQPGARFAELSWTWGDLSDEELAAIWDLTGRLGTEDPLVVAEDDAGATYFARGVHYGLFGRFERYGRREGEKSRWAFELREWV